MGCNGRRNQYLYFFKETVTDSETAVKALESHFMSLGKKGETSLVAQTELWKRWQQTMG
jgi:hypothetical protein